MGMCIAMCNVQCAMCIDSWMTRTVPGYPRCQGWGRSCFRPCQRPSPPSPLGSHLLLVSWCLGVNWPLRSENFELILLGPWGIDLIPCLLSLHGRLWITPRELQLHSLHWTSRLLRGGRQQGVHSWYSQPKFCKDFTQDRIYTNIVRTFLHLCTGVWDITEMWEITV